MRDSLLSLRLVSLGHLIRSRWRHCAVGLCRKFIVWRIRTLPAEERDEIRAALLADFDSVGSVFDQLKVALGTSYLSALTPPDIQDRQDKSLDYEVPKCDE